MKNYRNNMMGKIGLEREIIRIDKDTGKISQSSHPKSLGDSFQNKILTTDFSESQLEMIVPKSDSIEQVYQKHQTLMAFVQPRLSALGEYGWPYSMPPSLPESDENIPLARYKSMSQYQEAKLKEIYRQGLKYRYGPRMQCISGIHLNLSINPEIYGRLAKEKLGYPSKEVRQLTSTEHVNDLYMGMVRNFFRCSHLLPYLFGASSCFDKSFLAGEFFENQKDSFFKLESETMERFGKDTIVFPNATALRQTEIGYLPISQANLEISYNSLSEYEQSMQKTLQRVHSPYTPYQKRQLNANILQIENEYYSCIRIKANQIAGDNKTDKTMPTTATQFGASGESTKLLVENGIGYVEIRSLDISPDSFGGISQEYLGLVHLLFYYCLIKDSPPLTYQENNLLLRDYLTIAWNGGIHPEKLDLAHPMFREREYTDFLAEILDELQIIANVLDHMYQIDLYKNLLQKTRDSVLSKKKKNQNESLPSKKMIQKLKDFDSYRTMGIERAKEEQAFFSHNFSAPCPKLWTELEQSVADNISAAAVSASELK